MPEFVPGFEYVTYIAATPEQVWQALTNPEISRKYFFARSIEVDCRPDGRGGGLRSAAQAVGHLAGRMAGGIPQAAGSAHHLHDRAGREVVRLTLSEMHSPKLDDKYKEGGKRGWPMILSGLKTLLETGKLLPITPPQPPKT
jgi:activator of Hsp90 ATPase-like protein